MTILTCPKCKQTYDFLDNRWECECGSALELGSTQPFDVNLIQKDTWSLWRYANMLPVARESIVSMGEGGTALAGFERGDDSLLLKLEFTNPTGSYKDRGVCVVTSALVEHGVREVVEDSSGNAGASLAAYAAHAGIKAHIYVPAGHSSGKMKQIQAYGADLVAVKGSRADTARAAMEAAKHTFYASHAHSPYFIEGCKTLAYEIWEQMGGNVPERVISPLGQGSILLGLYKGFQELLSGGYSQRMPQLVGVQAEACSPVGTAFQRGLSEPVAVEQAGDTAAEGIKIGMPVRGEAVLRAIRKTNGAALIVGEAEILLAGRDLAQQGFFVEPTSAVTLAGHRQMQKESPSSSTVLILTGSGLKSMK